MTGVAGSAPAVPKTLGRWDLILLKVVAIVNINNVPPTAVYGKAALLLWVIAFLAFFVPEAVAVLAFARRYPGEGGIYLWIRETFGPAHGFLAGWCYWTCNLFYIPVLLVYMAGIFAFGGGAASAHLVDDKGFVAAVAFGWLALIAGLNIRGLRVGKWIQNVGGFGTGIAVVLVLLAAVATWRSGQAESAPLVAGAGFGMLASFSVMCNAFVGAELASTMGDEIRDPARDLEPAILTAGIASLGSYLLVTAAILSLVPIAKMGVIQGIMQAVSNGAAERGLDWMIGPVAIVLGLSIGGAASAWFAGSSRVPFVAGLTSALPKALGRIHPRWGSPWVALLTCAGFAALFTAASMVGASVAEAYQILLKAAVVIQLVPFLYLFAGLTRLAGTGAWARLAGWVGLVTTIFGIGVAFFPTEEVGNLALFEVKVILGVVAPVAIGWYLFRRSIRGEIPTVR